MDAKKAVVWGIFAFSIAALAVAAFFIVRECKKPRTPKKLLKEDLTLVAKRQEKDKNYKEAQKYMVEKADLTQPNQEMAKHAARLADRKALETIKVNSKKEKRF